MTSLSTPQKGLIEVGDPRQAAEGFVKKLRNEEKVDLVVILSHLGHDEDVKIAEKVKGIDLIVGAHSHTAMHEC
jgi:2',3'-cyclic-nucleotide 2'-phosphodiesterase/3'-nucleotidase/5'-nucleotidase